MTPPWEAAQAALALAQECLGDRCSEYGRATVETGTPVADCTSIAVVIGALRALNGSCMGRVQMSGSVEIHIMRCCEPSGDLSSQGGYTPPTPEQISAAVACLTRDAWAIYECVSCQACDVIGQVPGVTACCDRETGAPEIMWREPQGGCRSAIVKIPMVFTACCTQEAP